MTAADAPPAPIPVTLLTGFLGAGKTTILNHLVKSPAFADAVVVVNEFGEVALDHLLVEADLGDMVLLPSGCLCCAVRGDLMATLEDLLRRRDNGRIAPFRRVVIEPTGIADPVPVLQVLFRHPYLALRYRLAGIVTAVDAVNGAATLDRHPEALRQAALADLIVLTKTDLVADPAGTAALEARLARLAPGAAIVPAAHGRVDPARLADLSPDRQAAEGRLEPWLGAGAAGGDAPAHADAIRSFVLASDEPVAVENLDMFLDLLRSSRGPDILRVKGLVALADDPGRPVVIQMAQHLVHPPVRLAAWPSADRTTRLVFVTRDIDTGFIARLWDAFRRSGDSPGGAASRRPARPTA